MTKETIAFIYKALRAFKDSEYISALCDISYIDYHLVDKLKSIGQIPVFNIKYHHNRYTEDENYPFLGVRITMPILITVYGQLSENVTQYELCDFWEGQIRQSKCIELIKKGVEYD